MTGGASPFSIVRLGLGAIGGLARLFGAGAVLYGAHTFFLRLYSNEYAGIRFVGPNDCRQQEWIANADLIEAPNLCNTPVNLWPWLELYRRHWQEAGLYYSLVLSVVVVIGLVVAALQRRAAPASPFGRPQVVKAADEPEHLR